MLRTNVTMRFAGDFTVRICVFVQWRFWYITKNLERPSRKSRHNFWNL